MTTQREVARKVAPILARMVEEYENAASQPADASDPGVGVVADPGKNDKDAA